MTLRLFPYLLWAIFALPAAAMLVEAFTATGNRVFHELLHPSGEFAARFLIVALLATPLARLFRGRRWALWLLRNRRYFGVAAFGYAALHLGFYLADTNSLGKLLAQLGHVDIWTGWLAFAVFLPLAATSNDASLRRLGPARWKWIQRGTYAAAVLVALHWASKDEWEGITPALVHFAPLVLLTLYRLRDDYGRRQRMASSA